MSRVTVRVADMSVCKCKESADLIFCEFVAVNLRNYPSFYVYVLNVRPVGQL